MKINLIPSKNQLYGNQHVYCSQNSYIYKSLIDSFLSFKMEKRAKQNSATQDRTWRLRGKLELLKLEQN